MRTSAPVTPSQRVLKRVVDLVGASVLVVLTSPLLLAGGLAVVLTMGRPVIYREERAGIGGRPFLLLKLRTMRPLRPGETVPESDAARLTRVGRLLRATSIDELPTFVNVLRGDMSLVGPRPLPTRYLARFTPTQARRLETRPGVTGWAQVQGRNALTWAERLDLDVWYVDNRSLRLDLEILARTPGSVLRREGIGHDQHVTMPEFTGTDAERAEPT